MPDLYVSTTGKKAPALNQGAERHPGQKAKVLTAYVHHPHNVQFENQEKNEEIELFLRQHPVTNLAWILTALIMVFAPLLFRVFPLLGFLPQSFQTVMALAWYLLTSAFILESLFSWFFNIYLVTNKRVIDVDFRNLIYKEVSDAGLGRIQDVTYRMGGVVRTIFNYGDVFIQTAGAAPNFEFLAVPNPDKVVKILQELREGKHAGV